MAFLSTFNLIKFLKASSSAWMLSLRMLTFLFSVFSSKITNKSSLDPKFSFFYSGCYIYWKKSSNHSDMEPF
jgi:hypothetical protein